ncbi:MAG: hypothetical protein RMK34_05360 [Tepidimonas sp.]|uniref:hypothetical protein n=1 Tax=Tepidimonas sp. TaxID=2002775 RepID=UPI00298EE211|nr:hypothetical protein [Tepidimonas sp.]MDW8336381.1 hypothetical protein [Tepidimonas sp.]
MVAGLVLLLAGCAAAPQIPEWRLDWQQALEQGRLADLQGRERVARLQWIRAREAAAAAADADALVQVALWRCVIRLAAAQPGACPEAGDALPDASPHLQAYAAWLQGAEPPAALTGQGPFAAPRIVAALGSSASPSQVLAALGQVPDPLSRLAAGGWLWQAGRLPPEGVALMVETAAQQGWRRPLAAWLAVQQRWAQRAGDTALAERAARRLHWLLGLPPAAAPRPETPP